MVRILHLLSDKDQYLFLQKDHEVFDEQSYYIQLQSIIHNLKQDQSEHKKLFGIQNPYLAEVDSLALSYDAWPDQDIIVDAFFEQNFEDTVFPTIRNRRIARAEGCYFAFVAAT